MLPRPLAWFFSDLPWVDASAYGLLLALALSLGLAAVLPAPALRAVPRGRLLGALLVTGVAGVAGARWLPWLLDGAPAFDAASELPLVAYAGVVGGALALLIYIGVRKLPLRATFDTLAPPTALGLALARVGCFLAGCDYGVPSAAGCSVHYPAWALAAEPRVAAAALQDHAARGLVPPDAVLALSIHPVQLYESLLGLGLYLVLVRVGPRRDGLRVAILALGYGLGRFLLELLRGDADRGLQVLGTPWSASQVASLVAMAAATAWILLRRRAPNALN